MEKIKLTKGELKRQRDALRQYQRYLPTLQLKKQQLQAEILRQSSLLEERSSSRGKKTLSAEVWAGLLTEAPARMKEWLKPERTEVSYRNIAGLEVPVFQGCIFGKAEYDLFTTPLWVDHTVDILKEIVLLNEEMRVIEEGISRLKIELRVTTQRVNLFEKVKIPEAEEAIRRIRIYIGDQMANAVGRSKIAKRKIETAEFAQVEP